MNRLDMPQPNQGDSNELTALTMEDRKEFRASSENVLSEEASPLYSALLDSYTRENKEGEINLQLSNDIVVGDSFEVTNFGAVETSQTDALIHNRPEQSPGEAFAKDAIFVHGGKATFCYLPSEDKWYKMPGPCYEHKRSKEYQMISWQDKLHVVKSSDQRDFHVERYDPLVNGWFSSDWNFASLSFGMQPAQLVVMGDEIYAVQNQLTTLEVFIKKFDFESNSMEHILVTLPFLLVGACVVAMDKCLYVISGGWERQESQNSIFQASKYAGRFNTVENKWEEIASMQEPRFSACGVSAHGKIFIAGGLNFGRNDHLFMQTCEVYDASTNEWQFVASLKAPRADASMLCIEGTLYVVGGVHDIHRTHPALAIERYDLEKNKWKKKTKIPAKKSLPWKKSRVMFKACTQRVFEEVINKPTSNGDYSRLL